MFFLLLLAPRLLGSACRLSAVSIRYRPAAGTAWGRPAGRAPGAGCLTLRFRYQLNEHGAMMRNFQADDFTAGRPSFGGRPID